MHVLISFVTIPYYMYDMYFIYYSQSVPNFHNLQIGKHSVDLQFVQRDLQIVQIPRLSGRYILSPIDKHYIYIYMYMY